MLAAAIGIILAGLLLSLFLGPFGLIVAAVGLVLFVVWLIGLTRGGSEPPASPPPPPAA